MGNKGIASPSSNCSSYIKILLYIEPLYKRSSPYTIVTPAFRGTGVYHIDDEKIGEQVRGRFTISAAIDNMVFLSNSVPIIASLWAILLSITVSAQGTMGGLNNNNQTLADLTIHHLSQMVLCLPSLGALAVCSCLSSQWLW